MTNGNLAIWIAKPRETHGLWYQSFSNPFSCRGKIRNRKKMEKKKENVETRQPDSPWLSISIGTRILNTAKFTAISRNSIALFFFFFFQLLSFSSFLPSSAFFFSTSCLLYEYEIARSQSLCLTGWTYCPAWTGLHSWEQRKTNLSRDEISLENEANEHVNCSRQFYFTTKSCQVDLYAEPAPTLMDR